MIIFSGDKKYAYRDPALCFHKGVYYLFFTISEKDDGYMYNRVAMSTSEDLKSWAQPRMLTERNLNLNFCSPGNVIEIDDEFILCFTSYPMPFRYTKDMFWADDTARIFIMRTKNFTDFSQPELLNPKTGTSVEELGRMIDPFIIKKEDLYYIFYKQNGVSMSRSRDFKTWEYMGFSDAGENVCIVEKDNEYIMLHSPQNGIGIKKSKDLLNWEDIGHTTLKQNKWKWADGRLTAAFAMQATKDFKYKYILVFHASRNVFPETHGDATLALAFTDDFENFYYEL